MGGWGSGRPRTKRGIEDCRRIGIGDLTRGKSFLTWKNGFRLEAIREPGAVRFRYALEGGEEIDYQIPIVWTSCNYGGRRPWFLCPGQGCGRRAAKLYQGGKYFLCRKCYGLAYACQRKEKSTRLFSRAADIQHRLGWESSFDRTKPKRMHWKTFLRLVREYNDLQNEALMVAAAKLGIEVPYGRRRKHER